MILISPWARNTTEGKPSPKNYPHWPEVTSKLKQAGHDVVQLSCSGEPDVAATRRVNDLPLEGIAILIRECRTWISVDTFFQHMAWTLGRSGVVIFGSSDPEIFGHPENINLLKSRRFLRPLQFRLWSQEPYRPEIFVDPVIVVEAALRSIQERDGGR